MAKAATSSVERDRSCRCAIAVQSTLSPASELMPDRCTPEYQRTLAKMGAWLPHRCARRFLAEFFPIGDDPPWHETIRRRTTRVEADLERITLSRVKPQRAVPPSETMTVSIDAGHVRAVRGHHGRTFEVIAAQVSNDDGKPVLFSGVPRRRRPAACTVDSGTAALVSALTAGTHGDLILSDSADGGGLSGQYQTTPRHSTFTAGSPTACMSYQRRSTSVGRPLHAVRGVLQTGLDLMIWNDPEQALARSLDGSAPAHALVATWCSFDAPGPLPMPRMLASIRISLGRYRRRVGWTASRVPRLA